MCQCLIKRLRKENNLTQTDLAGNSVNREMISMIETGKTPITPNVAEIISANFKKAGVNISAEYLLDPIRYEKSLQAEEYISKIENLKDIEDIEEMLITATFDIFTEYDFPEINSRLYEKIAKTYENKNKIEKAYIYYMRALDNSIRIHDESKVFYLMIDLSKCLFLLKKYDVAKKLNNRILSHPNTEDRHRIRIYYNNALCYGYLKQYEKALHELELLENIIEYKNINQFYELQTIKASYNKEIGNYEKSISIYKTILDKLGDQYPVHTILCYVNLMNVYKNSNDIEKTECYLNIIIDLLSEIKKENNQFICDIYNELALGYKHINKIEISERYFIKAIQCAKSYKNHELMNKCISELFDLYKSKNIAYGIEVLLDDVFNLIEIKNNTENISLMLRFAQHYNEAGQLAMGNKILKYILNKNKGECLNET